MALRTQAKAKSKPVIGFLNSASANTFRQPVAAFRQGLKEAGYVKDKNVGIEFRWADGRYDRLPKLADELVSRKVTVLAAPGGIVSARAAEDATHQIPVLFVSGTDPVRISLVRPDTNATGVDVGTTDTFPARLNLLRELLPGAKIGMLINPKTAVARSERGMTQSNSGLVFDASTDAELKSVFSTVRKAGAAGLGVSADPFFTSRRAQIAALAARNKIPAIYPWSEYADAGGLMSYGPSLNNAYRQIGVYAGMILKGAKAADLPIIKPTCFELVINLKAAKKIGVEVPLALLARADRVIG